MVSPINHDNLKGKLNHEKEILPRSEVCTVQEKKKAIADLKEILT